MQDVLKLGDVVDGMKISSKTNFDCETCTLGKMSQYRSRQPDRKASKKLDLVHCDIAGPIDPPAKEGFRYSISFVDEYSGAITVYLLKNKSDMITAMERFLADTAPYGTVKRLRTDNGTEFTSEEFKNLVVKNRIKHEFSAPYSPHQNGTVERSSRTLYEMARCLLLETKLPKKLWTYALKTSAYIRNRCYNPRTRKTPFEMMTGHKPNLKNMHIFGTICYAYVQNKKKLDARCERGIFLGYDMKSPAYLIYFPEKDDVKRVRCVKFSKNFECSNDNIIDVPEEYSYSRHDEDEQLQIENSKEGADKRKDEESRYPRSI